MHLKAKRLAFKVAVTYVIVAVGWILFSDELLKRLVSDPDLFIKLSIFKRWAFVLVTSSLLYLVVRRLLNRWGRETEQRLQAEQSRQATVDLLRQNEEQYRRAITAANAIPYQKNYATDSYVFMGEGIKDITGYAAAEFCSTAWNNIILETVLTGEAAETAHAEAVRRIFAGELKSWHADHRIRTRSGEIRWVSDISIPLLDSGGKYTGSIGIIQDITERKVAEQKLRESEERYRQLFELETDAVVLVDSETRQFVDVNLSAQQLYGYSRAEFLQMKAEQVSDEPEKTRIAIGSGPMHVPLRWHRKKNGERFAVEISANQIEFHGRRIDLTTLRDITARQQVMGMLQEMTGQLLEAQHIARLGSYIFDIQTGQWTCSEVLDELFGIDDPSFTKDVSGWLQIVHPQERAEMQRYFQDEVLKKYVAFDRTYQIVRLNDQQERWVHGLGKLELDDQGRVMQMVGVIQDITERKRIEQRSECFSHLGLQLSTAATEKEAARIITEAAFNLLGWDSAYLTLCTTDADTVHQLIDLDTLNGQRSEVVLPADISKPTPMMLRVLKQGSELVLRQSSDAADPRMVLFGDTTRRSRSLMFVPVRCNDRSIGVLSVQSYQPDAYQPRDLEALQALADHAAGTLVRLQSEAALRQAGVYNRSLIEASLDPLVTIGQDGKITDVNAAAETATGYSRTELVGTDFCDYFTEPAQTRAVHEQVFRKGYVKDRTLELRHRDGHLKSVLYNASVYRDEHSGVAGAVVTAHDITERKQIEEQMNLQASALGAADNAIVITSLTGKIEWVNPAFTKLTGYSAAEAIGSNARMLKSGQHPPVFYANLWTTIITGNIWHGELVNRRKDGRLYTEEMTITPVRGADGQIAHFVAVKQDITERRLLDNRLQQAQKMEAIGTLAGGIAHDFNNILAAMFGYGCLLQQDTEGNPAAQENISEILKATNRAKELVQQILTFSRQREQKRQVIQLDSVIKEALKFIRASLPAQITIEKNLADDAPAVLADPTQIYQVTMNLATNALHAMDGLPGQLTVGLDAFRPDEKFLQLHPDFKRESYARLTLADTGHGMDAKTLERIFEPFFTTKPVGKGTGLGLAVVHGIVQAHEGVIAVESQVGHGTTFSLYFPAQKQNGTLSATAATSIPRGDGQKILLVDDEPSLTAPFQQLLKRLNYQVTISNHPGEAIRIFGANPAQFDLVITDLTMPELNGLEVARQLRAIRPNLPVILASGFTATLNQESMREAGICELLEKPISMSALAEMVQRALVKA